MSQPYLNQASRAVSIVPRRMLEIALRMVLAIVPSSASKLKIGQRRIESLAIAGVAMGVYFGKVDGTDRESHASFAGKARPAEKHQIAYP